MTCPSRLAAVSVGVAVLLIGSLAAAQLPSAEQRAFAGVDSAVARFNGASDHNEMVRAAGQVLDAAESALNAFAAADRARDAAAARYHAAFEQAVAVAVNCNNFNCNENNRINYFDGIEDSYARASEVLSAASAANATYIEAVGIPGAGEARERAARYRRIANRHRGIRDESQRRIALNQESRAENAARGALHNRATAAHVAANRAAIDALGRAGRTLSTAAGRLTDGNYPGTRAAELTRAAAELDRAVSAAADAEISSNSDRTDAALEGLIFASRETVVVLRSHVQLVEQAVGRYEADPDPRQPAAGGEPAPVGGAAVESEPAGDFAGWVRQVNAAVTAVEQAAGEAEQAAAGTGGWFTRSNACFHAEDRMTQAVLRVQTLTFGTRRPQFIPAPAGSEAWRDLQERIDEARQRARAACESIGPPPR